MSDSSKAEIDLPIMGLDGRQTYQLMCRSGDHVDPVFNWSGNLQCRLLPVPDEGLDNLLAGCPGRAKEWDNRGRFLKAEVVGSCASYPEIGARRSFRIRGMRLTLELLAIHPSPERKAAALGSYTLRVEVKPDSTADTSCAAAPSVSSPLVRDPGAPGGWRRICAAGEAPRGK